VNKIILISLLGTLAGCAGDIHQGNIEQAHTTAQHCNGDVTRSADYVIFDTEGGSGRQEVTATCKPTTTAPDYADPMKDSHF